MKFFCKSFFFPQANYTDPQTKLRFSSSEEFSYIRQLPTDVVTGYLMLRKATCIVPWSQHVKIPMFNFFNISRQHWTRFKSCWKEVTASTSVTSWLWHRIPQTDFFSSFLLLVNFYTCAVKYIVNFFQNLLSQYELI